MTKSYWIRLLYGNMAHVNNKFERKTKTGRRFHERGIFFRQSRRRRKFLGPRIALPRACQKENERISTTPFLLWHFSPGDKIENCAAQFFAVCWIVRVEFKVQRPRDGLSVSNALLLDQSLPAFIGHNLDQIGDGTLLQRCHLFQLVSLLLAHRQVELLFVLVLFGFWHWQFFTPPPS